MRGLLSFLILLTAFLFPIATPAAEPVTVSATPVTSFKGSAIGQSIGGLVFRGGLLLTADHQRFGGLSSLAFLDAERLVMVTDRGDLALAPDGGLNPTDCAFLPDGDLLVLGRAFGLGGFAVNIRRVAADDVRPGAIMRGETVLSAFGGGVDNFEGLGVRRLPSGETRLTLVSDNNFNGFQRTLLLDFAVP